MLGREKHMSEMDLFYKKSEKLFFLSEQFGRMFCRLLMI